MQIDWSKIYDNLKTAVIVAVSSITGISIGDVFVSLLGGLFQIGVTMLGAAGSWWLIERLKTRHNKNQK